MVIVDYVGRTSDGEIFDLSNEERAKEEGVYSEQARYEPIPVLIGEGYVIPGFEENLKGLEVGDEKEFTVKAENAYGERDSDQIETYPEKEFQRQDVNVNVGDEIMIGRRRGKVLSKSSGRVKIDFNHPLAGQDLTYEVEVLEKVENSEEIASNIFDFRLGHGDISFEDGTVVIDHHHEDEDHQHEIPEQVKEEIKEEIREHAGFEEVRFDED